MPSGPSKLERCLPWRPLLLRCLLWCPCRCHNLEGEWEARGDLLRLCRRLLLQAHRESIELSRS